MSQTIYQESISHLEELLHKSNNMLKEMVRKNVSYLHLYNSFLKALVVDDDFNTRDSVTKMLVKVGMRSEWTLSGKEAVLRARQSIEMSDAYHAYIIDWRLPDRNGIEVTRQIRSLNDDGDLVQELRKIL